MALGGPESPVEVPGATAPVAWLGLGEGEVFVQPAAGAAVVCNGARLGASHWVRDGDVLRIGPTQLEARLRGDALSIRVETLADLNPTVPPVVLVPPPRETPRRTEEEQSEGRTVKPIAFTPGTFDSADTASSKGRAGRFVFWSLLAVAAVLVAFLLTARTVTVQIEPEPERVSLEGFPPAVPLGSRFLVRSGPYTLVAEKEGYHRLEVPVEIGSGASQTLEHTLQPLPGRLVVDTGGVEGADVLVDGESVATTPFPSVDVEPGEREIVVQAEGYVTFTTTMQIEGRRVEQRLEVELQANSAPVTFVSVPAGATVQVDGRRLGTTPLTLPVSAGRRAATFSKVEYKPATRRFTVRAGDALTVPTVRLALDDAVLVLASDPPGGAVTVNGEPRGETPLEIVVAPRRPLSVRVAKPGHEIGTLDLEIAPGQKREESLALTPQLGEVTIKASPPDAQLIIDGTPRGAASQTLSLIALPHRIEIRREGFLPHAQTVTPRPGFPQVVEVELKSEEQARRDAMPPRYTNAAGHEMVLFEQLKFRMGAGRREPGRRANEPLRDVELVRPFYLATTEVSNAQFRKFMTGHDSGRTGTHALNMDSHPVVRVTWEQAAAYCNWLSRQEKLPPAYESKGGTLVARVPFTTGYRLPTEAEWERVARYPDGQGPLRYPWGRAFPIPSGAANYGDDAADEILRRTLPDYDDGYATTAPVDKMAQSVAGFFHMGGNVSEWMNDFYVITPSVSGRVVQDPVGPAEGEYHVIRGASWMDATVTELRLSSRDYGKEARPDLGFRVARYAE